MYQVQMLKRDYFCWNNRQRRHLIKITLCWIQVERFQIPSTARCKRLCLRPPLPVRTIFSARSPVFRILSQEQQLSLPSLLRHFRRNLASSKYGAGMGLYRVDRSGKVTLQVAGVAGPTVQLVKTATTLTRR